MDKLGIYIIKWKWFVIVLWILLAGIILWKAPTLSDVAKSDQASFLPKNSENAKASSLIKELYPEKGTGSSIVLTINRKGILTSADKEYALNLEDYLIKNKQNFQIRSITSPFSKKEFDGSMISKNNEAALMIINLTVPGYKDITSRVVKDIRTAADPQDAVKDSAVPDVPDGLILHVTGDAPLGQETTDNVHASMDMTMKITIVLVLLVLILIYRSPVAPFVPLFTIGLSFLVSRGIIAELTKLGLKVSSFTETFLIAVLFGAGTDYCLLLTSRFREEIALGKSPREALKSAFPTTSIAIISSGGTVVVGFFAMIIAKFGLYNTTGPSIAIGVIVTVTAVLTITPSILAILGERVFWPAHPSKNLEKERAGSPFWNKLSAVVTQKPVRFILICLVVFTPFLFSTLGITRSFDSLADLPKSSDTVKGFDVVKNNFDQGEMLPIKIVLKSDKDLWSNESLKTIDDVVKAIKKVSTVAKVRTATRPLGEQITETTLPKQLEMFSSGLDQINQGFNPLISGLDKMQGGVKEITEGISNGSSGMQKLVDNTKKVSEGISKLNGKINGMSKQINQTVKSASASSAQFKQSLSDLSAGVLQVKDGADTLSSNLSNAFTSLGALGKQEPALAKNQNYLTAYGTLQAIMPKMQELSQGMDNINSGIGAIQSKAGGNPINSNELEQGINSLNQALISLKNAIDLINEGQIKIHTALDTASSNLSTIASGFDSSKQGLNQMKSGIVSAKDAAVNYSSKGNSVDDVFYLPEGTLEKYPQLKDAMSVYISTNGKGVTFDVILSTPPYVKESLDSIQEIKNAAIFALKGSYLDKSEIHISGTTSAFSELRDITAGDFTKVVVFVLLGILIVLILLLRSITAPLYLIFTIIFSYTATMGITYLIFQVILGFPGLTWSVPFFSFCILVALGVDYNIFLMSRVKEEYKPGEVRNGIEKALASTGKIITSCGIIMAGTFGALIASPVHQLVEIGFTAVAGLLLDTFIIRCLLVPAIAVKVGELNWWPGKKVKIVPVDPKE